MTIQIVREQRITYSEGGLSEVHDDMYIKMDSDLADWLRVLDGAKLSTFMFIALREAYVCADKGDPATITSIIAGTSYRERAVRYAVDWLLQNEFISEGNPLPSGAKTYRPKAFAWFGRHKDYPAKNAPPSVGSANCKGSQPIIIDPLLLKENDNNSLKEEETIIIERRRILQSGGILGKPLEELSKKPIELETAQAWADWLQEQKATPKFNPQGTAVNALRSNPRAEPPAIRKPAERKREFHAQGVLWERLQAERAKKEKE